MLGEHPHLPVVDGEQQQDAIVAGPVAHTPVVVQLQRTHPLWLHASRDCWLEAMQRLHMHASSGMERVTSRGITMAPAWRKLELWQPRRQSERCSSSA